MEKMKHREAFCLMQYQNQRTKEIEIIWNSRDGVTPFMITSKDGKDQMQHVNCQQDVFAPGHTPKIGKRIFVDMQLEHSIPFAREYVNEFWDKGTYQMKDHPLFGLMSKEEATGFYAGEMLKPEGQPHIIEVTEEWLKELEQYRQELEQYRQLMKEFNE